MEGTCKAYIVSMISEMHQLPQPQGQDAMIHKAEADGLVWKQISQYWEQHLLH